MKLLQLLIVVMTALAITGDIVATNHNYEQGFSDQNPWANKFRQWLGRFWWVPLKLVLPGGFMTFAYFRGGTWGMIALGLVFTAGHCYAAWHNYKLYK